VIELDWWDIHTHEGVQFHLVPVQHWSGARPGRPQPDPVGRLGGVRARPALVLLRRRGYSRHFKETREKLAPHAARRRAVRRRAAGDRRLRAALVHEGAAHEPGRAVQAHQDLAARRSLGIHWGTFALTDEALDQPPRDLALARAQQGLAEQDFFVLPIGGTWWPAGPPAACRSSDNGRP
jgi:N-acyl-phosphatidylethanolamine-hydrolysing phospholipase D